MLQPLLEIDPTVSIPIVLTVVLLAAARIHSSQRWWCPELAWFWFPLRAMVWPLLDRILERVPVFYAKTRVHRDEYAATLDISLDELLEAVSDAGYEVQPLSSLARDWDGRLERASFARYYGRRPFPRAPDWLRTRQVHVRPFGPDGEIDVTAHAEFNPWLPLVAPQHVLGIGLEPAPEMVAEDLGIELETGDE